MRALVLATILAAIPHDAGADFHGEARLGLGVGALCNATGCPLDVPVLASLSGGVGYRFAPAIDVALRLRLGIAPAPIATIAFDSVATLGPVDGTALRLGFGMRADGFPSLPERGSGFGALVGVQTKNSKSTVVGIDLSSRISGSGLRLVDVSLTFGWL